jgi:3-dehydroquinate synthase
VEHLGSGFAEIIKSAALSGNGFWEEIKNAINLQQVDLFRLITESVNFKCGVVAGDPYDNSSRKVLNFGHTVGHALESYYNEPGRDGMLHGEAVAAGMICESYLSHEIAGLPEKDLDDISNVIRTFFELKPLDSCLSIEYLKMMDHDKKKTKSGPVFSLLKSPGQPVLVDSARHEDIVRSFGYFNDVFKK